MKQEFETLERNQTWELILRSDSDNVMNTSGYLR